MFSKLITLAVLALAGAGAALVAQTAWLAETATARVALAAKSPSVEVRQAIDRSALRLAATAWPDTSWHAGLEEAKAWARYQIAADEPGAAALTAAVRQGRMALAASPVHPAGWARMAALAGAAPTAPCAPRACLERSFETGLMGAYHDDRFKCARIRQAIDTGLVTKVNDRRVLATLADVREHPGIVGCLRGLPSDQVFKTALKIDSAG
jgi:hypothetical protein